MTATSPQSPGPVDASCRLPLFALFGGAAVWFAVAAFFGLMASFTFHKATLFADQPLLSYGRAYPAWAHLLVYGFAIPSGLGVGLWLLARLGRVTLAKPFLIFLGAKLWHIGVLVGLIAILSGENSGFEWLELPRYAAVILFLAFLLITLWALVTYSRRTVATLYPSQWFVIAALLWFPWILSTAVLLLQVFPVRGVTQLAVASWYAGNLLNVWLPLAGLAVTFYLLPKLTGRPLQSYYHALFVFWTLLLFGSWTGIPMQSPLPSWMPIISGSAAVLMLVPVLSVATIVLQTTKGSQTPCGGGPLCYVKFGVWCLVLVTITAALAACPAVARITDFTWFNHGQITLRLYGFFAMTLIGAIYFVLPQVAGSSLAPGRIKLHFWLAMPGAVLLGIPLLLGGVKQGLKLAQADVAFADASKAALMPFRLSTLGETMIAIGALVLCVNVLGLIWSYYRAVARVAIAEAIAVQPLEVKS